MSCDIGVPPDADPTQNLSDKMAIVQCRDTLLCVSTNYDALNRPIETGEYSGSTTFANANPDDQTFPTASKTKSAELAYDNITYTGQNFLRGRLARSISYRQGTQYITTHYSYNVFGRVEWIRNIFASQDKQISYEYDLLGNVTKKL